MKKALWVLVLWACAPALGSEAAEIAKAVQADDLHSLQELEKTSRKESLAFLTLVRKMSPEKKASPRLRPVEKGKVVRSGCRVTDALDKNARVLYSPRLQEEFIVLGKDDAYYRVRLPDGREGWIEEECLQTFSAAEKEVRTEFKGIADSEVNPFMALAEQLFASLAKQNQAAEKIFEKYRQPSLRETATSKEVRRVFGNISRYFRYADYFFREYVQGRRLITAQDVDALARLSAWGELFIGTADHVTEITSSQNERNKGGNRDISLGASYRLPADSQVDVSFSNRREIIQTPFSNTALQAGYARGGEDAGVRATVSYNSYQDEASEANSFRQLALRTGARLGLGPGNTLRLDYAFANNSYPNDPTAGFSNHDLGAGLKLRLEPEASFHLQVRSTLGGGESALHRFTTFSPSLGYERAKAASRLLLRLEYEMIDFKESQLRNFSRISLRFESDARRGARSRNGSLLFVYKTYPDNDQSTYLQLGGRYATMLNGRNSGLFSLSVTSNLFTANGANSHSEMRLDYGSTSQGFFSNLTLYGRFWHSPEATGGPAKPHALDLYAAAGLNTAFIKIGPVIAVHALVSGEEGVSFFKRDGNLFRVGGLAEASFPLPAKGKLTVNAAYEYGFVYNEEISIDTSSGDITSGEVVQRHPATFRISGQAAIPIATNLEFVARSNFYRIATDMDPTISINPVLANRMFLVLVGVRYRYN